MTGHTSEPWEIKATIARQGIPIYAIWTAGSGFIAEVYSRTAIALANARRIVACVNACAGIPTEALEGGALAEAIAALDDTARAYQAARESYLRSLKPPDQGRTSPAIGRARAVLAKLRP